MTQPSHSFWTPPCDPAAVQAVAAAEVVLAQRLQNIGARFGHVALASSLAAEDMVLTDLIARERLPMRIFTLNTGALHSETLAMVRQIRERYGIEIEEFLPDTQAVAQFEAEHGRAAMYESLALRRECCRLRKSLPLARALAGADAWLTGQRREQSATRADLPFEEFDHGHGLAKFNPLFDWSEALVWAYIDAHQVPVNALYAAGYPSIGCEPCTKPVRAGDDIRSGRWWWESQESKECGLHK